MTTSTVEQINQINDINLINASIPDDWRSLIDWEGLEFEQREAIVAIPNYDQGKIVYIVKDLIIIEVFFSESTTIYLIDGSGEVVEKKLF